LNTRNEEAIMADNGIPSAVITAAEKAADKHGDDIRKAVATALVAIRKMPDYAEFSDALVRSAVQEFVYDARHRANIATRAAGGEYGGPSKVAAGSSAAVSRAAASVYAYFIGGRTLGSIKGEELEAIAESEQAKAEGHGFNATLCETLAPLVPEGKTVKQAIGERKLRGIFQDTQG
jgi:hypothetical protein